MNTSRYTQFLPNQQPEVTITYVQFGSLLKSLSPEQAQQLSRVVQYHAFIHHDRSRSLFSSSHPIMQEIEYLMGVASAHDITSLQSSRSELNQTQSQLIKEIYLCYALNINANNYAPMMRDVYAVKAQPHNVFELLYEHGQKEDVIFDNKERENSEKRVMVTNRCCKNRKIFMIFQKVHQILELQTLIDTELNLADLSMLIDSIQKEQGKMLKWPLGESTMLFFFKRTSRDNWLRFISNLNKEMGDEDIILLKYKHFQELLSFHSHFNHHVRVAVDESELQLDVARVSKCRVLRNNVESMHRVTNLVLSILKRGERHLSYNEFKLDEISCFNYFLLQSRNAKEIFFIRPGKNNTKMYIYFVFYRTLMLAEKDNLDNSVRLTEKPMSELTTDNFYILALESMKKHAIVNEIPFILLYQQAQSVEQVALQKCQLLNEGDYAHLLAYEYILGSPKYKMESDPIFHRSYMLDGYEKPFKFIFNRSSPIYGVLGKLRSEEVVSKSKFVQKGVQKGCLEGYSEFSRQFVRSLIQGNNH